METNDGFEEQMRHVLHGDDGRSAGFTAAQVIAGSRHRRRARTAAVSGVALVAAGAVAVVPSALVGGHGHGGAVSAGSGLPAPIAVTSRTLPAPASPPSSPVTPATSAPTVRVVQPGKIPLADGTSITLTTDSVTFTCPGGRVGPQSTDNGVQPSISVLICGRLLGGVYNGGSVPASGEVTVNGTVHPATVLTLVGHPGWSLVYVDLAVAPPPPASVATSVYDAAGHLLASSTTPRGR
ncbi:hypothetical protein [Catenulispora pinisilvae]|uniref:hypothetical protein n=1 Tax=Catenulispora pinisilvae TaxID=2705253 RepID=UPI001890DE6F|nr:hypothetical protein [Catenulispora pinisilvae]